ncbi:hypothetical protein Syn6312_2665 [Synechococcus sp. PCC 6312]|nr:hypothetical protein Syn6312_2665 [Synechococcus sp. PCC 6312]
MEIVAYGLWIGGATGIAITLFYGLRLIKLI